VHSMSTRKMAGGAVTPPELTRAEQILAAEVKLILLQRLSDTFLSWVSKIDIIYRVGAGNRVWFLCEIFVLVPGALTTTRLDYDVPFDGLPSSEVVAKDIIGHGEATFLRHAEADSRLANAFRQAATEISR
jgi:hypothetical protein